jgi:hypothetical protein
MKKFKDLEFTNHIMHNAEAQKILKYEDSNIPKLARLIFDNGYGVSVVSGWCAHADKTLPYEVAVLKDYSLCYDTDITNDVIGYCNKEKVSEIMKKIQELK